MSKTGLFGLSSLYDATSNIKSINDGSPNNAWIKRIKRNLQNTLDILIILFVCCIYFPLFRDLQWERMLCPRSNSQNAPWCVLHFRPLLIKDTYEILLCFLRGQNPVITQMLRPLPRHHFSNSSRRADSRSEVIGCAPFASWQ